MGEVRETGEDRGELARRYHDPRYLGLLVNALLGVGGLALIALTPPGQALLGIVDALPEALGAFLLGVLLVGVSALVRLPIGIWLGLVHERRFGFSRQSAGAFALDRLKATAVESLLTGAALAGLALSVRVFPSAWPVVAAAGAATAVLLLGFVAPIVLEPLFNRFRPLEASALREAVLRLGVTSGVPVSEVLVADASRRTTKLNAYVSGLGATRRVVLFDTLVERASGPEILTVVAHELGHRRYRHVALGTAIAMAGAVGVVLALWGLLSSGAVRDAIDASGPGDARVAAFALLVAAGLGLLGAPLYAWLSRRWEYACDRFALEQTGNFEAFESAFGQLSESNLPDPAPPRLAYIWLFSHPTVPARLEAARLIAQDGESAGADSPSRKDP